MASSRLKRALYIHGRPLTCLPTVYAVSSVLTPPKRRNGASCCARSGVGRVAFALPAFGRSALRRRSRMPDLETKAVLVPAELVAGDHFKVSTEWGATFTIAVPEAAYGRRRIAPRA